MALLRLNSPLRSALRAARGAALALAAVIGATAFAPAEAHATVRCVAEADTITGRDLEFTRARAERQRPRAACAEALNRCEARLNQLRRRVGFAFPLARCRVVRQVNIGGGGVGRVRCVAEAIRRNGASVPNTLTRADRQNRRRACAAALSRCEARLDNRRIATGRPMRAASCEVIRTRRL